MDSKGMRCEDVVESVRREVVPSEDEMERLNSAAESLQNEVNMALQNLSIPAAPEDMKLVGSTSRGTWVSGDYDIDLFIRFSSDVERSEMAETVRKVGWSVLSNPNETYADHPYVVGDYNEFKVDLVPCVQIGMEEETQTAVDRTPLHTQYVSDVLTDTLQDDIRVAKQFLKSIGVYGADTATNGFSGLLTELLVIEHGGFIPLLEMASDWNPPVEFVPNDNKREEFSGALVVIDPVYGGRNVAANLSNENVARFQHQSRQFLRSPSTEWFERKKDVDVSLSDKFAERGTTPFVLGFDRPQNAVDDDVIPQLQKSVKSIRETVESHGFEVIGTEVLANDSQVGMFLEASRTSLPNIERHVGPHVSNRQGAENFTDAYKNDKSVNGPFIVGEKLAVDRPRKFTNLEDMLTNQSLWGICSFGPIVEQELVPLDDNVYTKNTAVRWVENGGFTAEIHNYFNPDSRK